MAGPYTQLDSPLEGSSGAGAMTGASGGIAAATGFFFAFLAIFASSSTRFKTDLPHNHVGQFL
jgi:hypothetical protein